jgi:hypothetical protein
MADGDEKKPERQTAPYRTRDDGSILTPKVVNSILAGAMVFFGGGGAYSASKLSDKIDDIKLSIVRLEGAAETWQKTSNEQAQVLAALRAQIAALETKGAAEHEKLEEALRRIAGVEARIK